MTLLTLHCDKSALNVPLPRNNLSGCKYTLFDKFKSQIFTAAGKATESYGNIRYVRKYFYYNFVVLVKKKSIGEEPKEIGYVKCKKYMESRSSDKN